MIRLTVNAVVKLLFTLMARVRIMGKSGIPGQGPFIVVTNHINFLEIPLLYFLFERYRPRALTKAETWNNPVLRVLANLWDAIPLRRGTADRSAFGAALSELQRGGVVIIAPEGTRSHHGRLQRASAGVVVLAARSGAPIIPVAHWGGERVMKTLMRFHRSIVRVRVGRRLVVGQEALNSRASRSEELTRIMQALADLMPTVYRGYYARA